MSESDAAPLFSLGDLYFSRTVSDLLLQNEEICKLVGCHAAGDWGELSRDMQAVNKAALTEQDIVMSMYQIELAGTDQPPTKPRHKGGAQIWIVTEIERGVTTVMLSTELGGGYGRSSFP